MKSRYYLKALVAVPLVAVACFRTEFLSLLGTVFSVMSLPMRVGGLNLEIRSGHMHA